MKCPECNALMTADFCGCGYKMFSATKADDAKKASAHQPYVTTGERSAGAAVNKYINNIKKKTSGGRRNVFLPGESWPDYQAAKHKAKEAGISAEKFDMERMKLNGWTEELEAGFILQRK